MADPVDLSMVVSSAHLRFSTSNWRLYSLDAGPVWVRLHRRHCPRFLIPAAVVGELELPLNPDEERVQARLPELRAYALGLAHYHANPAGISPKDSLLPQTLSDLPGALEDIYGQRFTFEGERREQSGPFSDQRCGQIAGEVIGMEATNVIRGTTSSKITAESVERGGRVVGMRALEIGGGG